MSTLSSLTKNDEKNLIGELHWYLNTKDDKEIQVWPNEFLKSHNIIQDLTERELKVLNIDYWSTIKKIAHHHPQLLFYWDVQDTRYDFASYKPKQVRETIRIRRKKDYYSLKERYLLTIKKKNMSKDIKERPEFEVPIKDIAWFDRMFRSVSLLPLIIKEKVRSSYSVEDIVLDIDLYYHEKHNIPPFIEVEWNDENHIREWIRKLDLEDHKVVNWSSRQLLRFYDEWPDQQSWPTTNDLAKTLLESSQNGNGKYKKNWKDKKTGSKK